MTRPPGMNRFRLRLPLEFSDQPKRSPLVVNSNGLAGCSLYPRYSSSLDVKPSGPIRSTVYLRRDCFLSWRFPKSRWTRTTFSATSTACSGVMNPMMSARRGNVSSAP